MSFWVKDPFSASSRLKHSHDWHRRDLSFMPGEWVWLRLQIYRQLRGSAEVGKARAYGPFKVLEPVEKVAYRL